MFCYKYQCKTKQPLIIVSFVRESSWNSVHRTVFYKTKCVYDLERQREKEKDKRYSYTWTLCIQLSRDDRLKNEHERV